MRHLTVALLLLAALPVSSHSQDADQTLPPARSWVVDAVKNEIPMIDRETIYLRYQMRRVNEKGDIIRDTYESKDGSVARLIRINNQPLTSEADRLERERLTDLLNNPSSFGRHHKHDRSNTTFTLDLVRVMPDAMIYTYVPGQPQLPSFPGHLVVLDFKTNPAFHPQSAAQGALASLEGRAWIDQKSHHMVRMEGRIARDTSFAWGLIAKIYKGGTLQFDQAATPSGLWYFSRLEMNINVRELMVHMVPVHSVTTLTNVQQLPGPVGYQQAIHTLLDTPLPH